jgi:hypothetical protein
LGGEVTYADQTAVLLGGIIVAHFARQDGARGSALFGIVYPQNIDGSGCKQDIQEREVEGVVR